MWENDVKFQHTRKPFWEEDFYQGNAAEILHEGEKSTSTSQYVFFCFFLDK